MAHNNGLLQGHDGALEQSSFPTKSGSSVNAYHNASKSAGFKTPALILTHGWPQSSYLWRHQTKPLSEHFPIFVPDLPGYGFSTPSTKGDDKLTVAQALVEAFQQAFPHRKDIILIAHDRGARVSQRLVVSKADFPSVNILGYMALDIAPIWAQFSAMGNPHIGASYYHWHFLPRTELSIPMIMAYGPGKYIHQTLLLTRGQNKAGQASGESGDALAWYSHLFDNLSVTTAAAEDYKASVTTDYDIMVKDQEEGRKVDVPTKIMYTAANLAKMHDVKKVWNESIVPGTDIEFVEVGDEIGHYIPEEAPEQTLKEILAFVAKLGHPV